MNKNVLRFPEQGLLHLKDKLGDKLQWEGETDVLSADEPISLLKIEEKVFRLELRNEIRPQEVEDLQKIQKEYGKLLVVANYISSNAKKLLISRSLNFADRAGNIWFRSPNTYIYIDGIPNEAPFQEKPAQAFSKTGLKVVFIFLNQPELVNATYREIAKASQVSLGTVAKVVKSLRDECYLIKKDKNHWMIAEYRKLLERWQIAFSINLKPSLFIRSYRPVKNDFHTTWKQLKLSDNSLWSGEAAADLLTNYLKPASFTLYTKQSAGEIMRQYKWMPDPAGEIVVYQQFWEDSKCNTQNTWVPVPLVFADLMATEDSRCIETANIIYEKFLQSS